MYSRGAKEKTIQALGLGTIRRTSFKIPDAIFADPKRFGPHAERLEGALVWPLFSVTGEIIGMEARQVASKTISKHFLPEAEWNPVWISSPRALEKIWAGGDIWLCEGLFDLCPLEWVVPETDAVLATLRAFLGRNHVDFLARMGNRVHVAYDNDLTGRRGTDGYVDDNGKYKWGALKKLSSAGVPCSKVSYVGGKDPGEIWDRGGVAALREAFRRYI